MAFDVGGPLKRQRLDPSGRYKRTGQSPASVINPAPINVLVEVEDSDPVMAPFFLSTQAATLAELFALVANHIPSATHSVFRLEW